MLDKLLGEAYWDDFGQFLKEIESMPFKPYNGDRSSIDLISESFVYKSFRFFSNNQDDRFSSFRDIDNDQINLLKEDVEKSGFNNLKLAAIKECTYFLGIIEASGCGGKWGSPEFSDEACSFLKELELEEDIQELLYVLVNLSSLYRAIISYEKAS